MSAHNGSVFTPAANHPFEVKEDVAQLNESDVTLFHHIIAFFVYANKEDWI